MSRHRWKWTPMRANPTVTDEWLSSQVPSARLCLARDLAAKCGYAGYCEKTCVTILGNSAEFGLGCLAGLCSTAQVRSMRSEMKRHCTQAGKTAA